MRRHWIAGAVAAVVLAGAGFAIYTAVSSSSSLPAMTYRQIVAAAKAEETPAQDRTPQERALLADVKAHGVDPATLPALVRAEQPRR